MGKIAQVFSGAAGAAAGGGASLGLLYWLGADGLSASGISTALAKAGNLFGCGMAAGVFVMALPAVLLSAGAVGLVSGKLHKKQSAALQARKEEMESAVVMMGNTTRSLQDELNLTKKRLDAAQEEFRSVKQQMEQAKEAAGSALEQLEASREEVRSLRQKMEETIAAAAQQVSKDAGGTEPGQAEGGLGQAAASVEGKVPEAMNALDAERKNLIEEVAQGLEAAEQSLAEEAAAPAGDAAHSENTEKTEPEVDPALAELMRKYE